MQLWIYPGDGRGFQMGPHPHVGVLQSAVELLVQKLPSQMSKGRITSIEEADIINPEVVGSSELLERAHAEADHTMFRLEDLGNDLLGGGKDVMDTVHQKRNRSCITDMEEPDRKVLLQARLHQLVHGCILPHLSK